MDKTLHFRRLLILVISVLCSITAFSQSISIECVDMPMDKVISVLEEQSNYSFVYQKNELRNIPSVTYTVRDGNIENVVDAICRQVGLSYEIVQQTIVLKKAEQKPAVNIKVSGRITAEEDGLPIPYASVIIDGTKTGVEATEDGRYTVSNVPENGRLKIQALGYETLLVDVRSKGIIDVVLKRSTVLLEETIVVAYGTAKKGSITGSAAVVDNNKLSKRVVANVTKSIEGNVAGVQMTSGSGQPGEGSSIIIRGYGSINASKSPLIVLDGIPYDGALAGINPNDIESITVLKDASSGALYGARGANGVLLITTKKGKAGKVKIQYTGTVGLTSNALPYYDRTSQKDFVQLTYESLRNDFFLTGSYSWEQSMDLARKELSGTFGGEIYNPFKNYTWETIIGDDGYVRSDAVSAWDEDWLEDGIVNNSALRQEHVVTISGGSENIRAMLSLGYLDEEGYVSTTGFERYSGRANIDANPTKWLAMGLNMSFSKATYEGLMNSGNSYGNQFYYAQLAGPIYPVYEKDEKGNTIYDEFGNKVYDYGDTRTCWPGWSLVGLLYDDSHTQENVNTSVRTYLTLGTDDDKAGFLKGLKFTVNFGADNRDIHETNYNNMYNGSYAASNGRLQKYAKRTQSFTINQLLTYNRTFGDHSVDFVAGHEYYQYQYKYLYGTKTNLVDGILELRPATSNIDNDSYSNRYTIESYLSRLNYSYKDKYYISASVRRDGSSRFHKDYRWGNFWSVGGNWRVTQEKFMKNVNWINNLNVKASYGVQGNDDLDTYYAWQSFYNLNYSNDGMTGAMVSSLENTNISWEKNSNFNVGIEAKMFNSRLDLNVEWYSRKTTDMLLNYPMALSTGFSGYDANTGSLINKGIEFSVSGVLLDKKNILWRATVIGTSIKNKILELTTESPSYQSGQHRYEEGRPIYTFYMPRFAGVNPETGAEQWYAYESMDENGNAVGEYITEDYSKATASRYYLGSRIPKFNGSFGMDFELFKNIDINILTTFSLGGKVYDSVYKELVYPSQYARAISSDVLDRWQKPGDITDEPRMSITSASANISDRFLINASYFTIKNITIGYTLPHRISNKIGASKVRIYASLDNLKTFSHLNGMNPQYNIGGSTTYIYAPSRTSLIGLNLEF